MQNGNGFVKGVNLGGWLSQCDYSTARLDRFITESDFEQIAHWGFDHVRIPIDYNVILLPDGQLSPAGFARIDRALEWSATHGLRTVLDLHKTPGFSFDEEEGEAGFFADEKYQELFYTLWEAFARRYGPLGGRVRFELLNEVTEARFLPAWKRISRECVRRIRPFAPDTDILIGSYLWNSVTTLPELDAPYDEHVIYNFHCYDPHDYTHQGAYWEASRRDISQRIPFAESGVTEQYFDELFAPAVAKARAEGTTLYCGEYGVIDVVPPEDALLWFQAIHLVFEKYGIGRCLWSYKEMDFGFSDCRMDTVRERLLALL
ncbi:MAG: cellulase family glycosylhydrolase [Oscillospiraceae bacterium]|nr:cellulase family glycosylhydrolase [Oscillospiraceae bacterium]